LNKSTSVQWESCSSIRVDRRTDRHDITRLIVVLTYGNIPLSFRALYIILITMLAHRRNGINTRSTTSYIRCSFYATPHRICKIFQLSSAVTKILGLMEVPSFLRYYAVFISMDLPTFRRIKMSSASELRS